MRCLSQTLWRIAFFLKNDALRLQSETLSPISTHMARLLETLTRWTGTTRAVILFDSDIGEFSTDAFFWCVRDTPSVVLVVFTADGDVFGVFFSRAVTTQNEVIKDPNIFFFSLESHGRCETPQRFVVRREFQRSVWVLFNEHDRWTGRFGEVGLVGYGCLFIGNERSETACCGLSRIVESIEDTTLTGWCAGETDTHTYRCIRLIAVHLI